MKNPDLFDDDSLHKMMAYQSEFMDILISKNKLPNPLSINTSLDEKSTQTFMRELGQFFLEELYEASNCYHNLFEIPKYTKELQENIEAFNEELADCTAFILEIWIFLGITNWDIRSTVISHLQSYGHLDTNPAIKEEVDTLKLVMQLANYRNTLWGYYTLNSSYDGIPIVGGNYKQMAGRRLHIANQATCQTLNYQVTASYYRASNMYFKSKPWRDTETPVNQIDIRREFIEVGLNFFQLTDFYGANKDSILNNYIDKYEENKRRQEEGY
jgi:dimeric dUTPase (all-alpha-NTP-PPase superfamily)